MHQDAARRFNSLYGLPKFPFATLLTFFGGQLLGANGFDMAPVKKVGKLGIPLLLIQGTSDRSVLVEDARAIYDAANEPKELWIVEGAGHLQAYYEDKDAYERKILGFFGS